MIHRNLHPDAVLIQTKSLLTENESDDDHDDDENNNDDNNTISHQQSMQSIKSVSVNSDKNSHNESFSTLPSESQQLQSTSTSTTTDTIKKKNQKPLYQVMDFWFFHNPRKVNCQFSAGRADWGSRITAPPELANHSLITDKSDVWALGICIYMWATKGLTIPFEEHNQINHERLHSSLPLKWGDWLNSLIKMCLQRNPKFRATSKDIYQFLVIASSKK